ncbi:MAG: EF-hand domain-containing protein [Candidatus Marinimicrobia bacterium]|nr:EF-hand domain-containing protein [Candidatus Neomarinimicrobiota bacterium]
MKIITRTCLAALFLFSFNLLAQDEDPCGDADYPVDPPGEDGGCIDYADCNDNGAYDLGEPCFDGDPGEGGYTEDDEGDDGEEEDYGDYGGDDDMDDMDDGDDEGNGDEDDLGYGDHTVENCISLSEGRETYWIGEDEFAVWDDPNVDCGYLLDEIGFMPPPGPPSFDEIDADGNGEVNIDEARAFFQDHDPEFDDADFEKKFNDVDANDDGVVDQAEHDAAVADMEDMHHEDGEDGDHGDEGVGEPQDSYYCAICDMDFGTAEEMDQHAADMGHVDTDYDHEEAEAEAAEDGDYEGEEGGDDDEDDDDD